MCVQLEKWKCKCNAFMDVGTARTAENVVAVDRNSVAKEAS